MQLYELKPKIRKDEKVSKATLEILAESTRLPATYRRGNENQGNAEFAVGPARAVVVYNGRHPEEDYFSS